MYTLECSGRLYGEFEFWNGAAVFAQERRWILGEFDFLYHPSCNYKPGTVAAVKRIEKGTPVLDKLEFPYAPEASALF